MDLLLFFTGVQNIKWSNCKSPQPFFSAAVATCLASTTSTTSDCDLFQESELCISQMTNLIYRRPTEDEVVCQELCQSYTRCTHFSFMEASFPLQTGQPDFQCYLWKKCISKVIFIQENIITTKTNPLPDTLLHHGLHLLCSRPRQTPNAFFLLFPVPSRSLQFPSNPNSASHG